MALTPDEEAAKLLPCWNNRNPPMAVDPCSGMSLCRDCQVRPAVAAALREAEREHMDVVALYQAEKTRADVTEAECLDHQDRIAELEAENERLQAALPAAARAALVGRGK